MKKVFVGVFNKLAKVRFICFFFFVFPFLKFGSGLFPGIFAENHRAATEGELACLVCRVRNLPVKYRVPFLLYLSGHSVTGVAERLGISVGRARRRIEIGRRMLSFLQADRAGTIVLFNC